MLNRKGWTEYPREKPFAPGFYIVWAVDETGWGSPDIMYYSTDCPFTDQNENYTVTHWSDFQSPIPEARNA
jgi:hypothetical protein